VLTIIEIAATLLTLVYIYFAAQKKAIAWIFGIVAASLSAWLFFKSGLPGSGGLNIVYALQGIVGYFYWKNYVSDKKPAYGIRWYFHLLWLLACLVLAYGMHSFLVYMEYENVNYMDMFLATGCILATALEIRKDISCWWYWIVFNIGYSSLYLWQSVKEGESLYFYSGLMLVLAAFSYWGLRKWTKDK
jgi:nicotinamide mononucleotide transporter PnuC